VRPARTPRVTPVADATELASLAMGDDISGNRPGTFGAKAETVNAKLARLARDAAAPRGSA
jgi:hypothetical protein